MSETAAEKKTRLAREREQKESDRRQETRDDPPMEPPADDGAIKGGSEPPIPPAIPDVAVSTPIAVPDSGMLISIQRVDLRVFRGREWRTEAQYFASTLLALMPFRTTTPASSPMGALKEFITAIERAEKHGAIRWEGVTLVVSQ
jgi:hypothetical protein